MVSCNPGCGISLVYRDSRNRSNGMEDCLNDRLVLNNVTRSQSYLSSGQFSTMIQYFIECGMPRKIAEYDQTGIIIGRMTTIAERPLRFHVRQYE